MSDDLQFHLRAAREKRLAALDEYEKKRNSVVGDLAIKAVEQAIEVLVHLRENTSIWNQEVRTATESVG